MTKKDSKAIKAKILYLLGKNSRYSLGSLARACATSKENVSHHIKALQDDKIIRGFTLTLNHGLRSNSIMVQFLVKWNYGDIEAEARFHDDLLKSSEIIHVAQTAGHWDYIITVHFKDFDDFGKWMESYTTQFKSIIAMDFLFIFDERRPGWKVLFDDKSKIPVIPSDKTAFTAQFQKAQLIAQSSTSKKLNQDKLMETTEFDDKLIKLLAPNVRIPIAQLAKQLNSSYRTVRARISHLISTGYIKYFHLAVKVSDLQMEKKTIILKFNEPAIAQKNARKFFDEEQLCSSYWHTFGSGNFRANVYVKNTKDFEQLLVRIKREFAAHLISLETLNIVTELKRVIPVHHP